MDNLELLEYKRKTLDATYQNITHFGLDSGNYYFLSTGKLFKCDIKTNDVQPIVSDYTFTNVQSFDVLNFENKIFVGDGVSIHVIDISVEEVTQTTLPKACTTLCFNPTQEIAAIVFTDRTLGTYKFDFITRIFEQRASSLDAEVPDTVVVGSGRFNALFEVSEVLSKDELGNVVQEVINDTRPRICWRQNGEEFVVNYWENDRRLFKVFMLPCTPQYICQDTIGILPSIDWAPQGNRITCVLSTQTGPKIVLYEKNGQRRNYSPIHCETQKVLDLKWSPCARILAVHGETDSGTFLNLITNKNYKWYTKQQLIFTNENPLIHFQWNSFESSVLSTLVVVTARHLIVYTYKFEIHMALKSDTSAVIDGAKLILTMFDEAMVPVHGTVDYTFEASINFVRFHPQEKKGAIFESSNRVSIFTFSREGIQIEKVIQLCVEQPAYIPLNERLFHWINMDLCFVGNMNDIDEGMYRLNITGECIFEYTPIEGIIGTISLSEQPGCHVEISTEIIVSRNAVGSDLCFQIDYFPVHFDAFQIGNIIYVIVLSIDRRLYINQTCICGNVTSFFVRMPYLLLTNTENRLFCARLNEKEVECLLQNGISEKHYYSKTIEQGAKIISCSSKTLDIVLEMPRGNLEAVMCYVITIDHLESLLKEFQWKKAMYLIRTERLDWNLLFDLNSERFLKHIPDIIRECETAECLNCLVTEISNDSCFPEKYAKWSSDKQKSYPKKKFVICNAIMRHLKSIDYAVAMESIIFISIRHLGIGVAFEYLADLIRRSEDNIEPDTVRNCIRILRKHVPEETVYEAALLTYDLVLVRYLAKEIQMDPQVYEPLLARLSQLEPAECRFEINHMLKRYKEAVIYLLRIPNKNVQEIREYISTHSVTPEAFTLCPKSLPIWKDVGQLYAEYISSKGDHLTAGYVYMKIEMCNEAIDEFILACHHNGVVQILCSGDYNNANKSDIFKRLADRLRESNNYVAAASIYDDHLCDYLLAITVLLDGHYFLEATTLACKRGVKNLIESMIVPSTIEHVKASRTRFLQIQNLFEQYRQRLKTVRNLRIEALTNVYDPDQNPDSDLLSSVGSTSSQRSTMSAGSRTSSRSKRRQKRKALDLREGGIYEDIAIIRVLHDFYKEIAITEKETKAAHEVLYIHSNVDIFEVRSFCEEMSAFIDHMINNATEIWPPCFLENYPSDKPEDRAIFQNIEYLDHDYRTPPILDRTRKTLQISTKHKLYFDK